MAHAPPVPPDQQSDKVEGAHSPPDTKPEVARDPAGGTADRNLKEQGEAGNRNQNFTPHLRTQDR
ncbi:MAG: hypothetical protein INR64_02235 [Caulobacteraceae bacterium]|nr:hypothetical protein [Caulobacter sp.]